MERFHNLKHSSDIFWSLDECINKGNILQLSVSPCLCLEIGFGNPQVCIGLLCRGVRCQMWWEDRKVRIISLMMPRIVQNESGGWGRAFLRWKGFLKQKMKIKQWKVLSISYLAPSILK
jgi:hypothetical protein